MKLPNWIIRAWHWLYSVYWIIRASLASVLSEVILTTIFFATATAFIVIFFEYSHQVGVILYKCMVTMAGALIGYLIDLGLFQRGGQLRDQKSEIGKAAVMLRRGFIVGVMALAMANAM